MRETMRTAYLSVTPGFTFGFQWCSCYSVFSFLNSVLLYHLLSFCPSVSFGYCIVSSSISSLPPWYLQTVLNQRTILSRLSSYFLLVESSRWNIDYYFLWSKILAIWLVSYPGVNSTPPQLNHLHPG